MKELGKRLLKQEDLPVFEPVDLTLEMLMAEGVCAYVGHTCACLPACLPAYLLVCLLANACP